MPTKSVAIVNIGFFKSKYLFMSNSKELLIYDFVTSETQIVNTNYAVFTDKVIHV